MTDKTIQSLEGEIDTMVRDFSSVSGCPKSEIRRRILDLLSRHSDMIREMLVGETRKKWINGNFLPHTDERYEQDSYNRALSDTLSLINNLLKK